jgi:hypothetical protein
MNTHAAEDVDQDAQAQLVAVGQPFRLSEHGLAINGGKPTFEECATAADKLKKVHGALAYWLGDLINLTEGLFHEEASQIIDKEFLSEKDVSAFRFVAERVSLKTRALAPSWQHAQAVAALKPAEQEKWLQKALDEDWIASKLKAEVQADDAGGASKMRFLLIVDAGTEAKQIALADRLEKEGYRVTKRSGLKKEAKPKKIKGEKKKVVTTRGKKRGVVKPYARRRK